MKLNITTTEAMILTEICEIQIASYQAILAKQSLETEVILSYFPGSLEDVLREGKWRITQYEEVIKTPNYIGILEDSELSTMRHILFHLEEYFIKKYGLEYVYNLWRNFFKIEFFRNHTTITLKTEQNDRCTSNLILVSK